MQFQDCVEYLDCPAVYDLCSKIWTHFSHHSNANVWEGNVIGVQSLSVPWFEEKTHLTIK